MSDELARFGKGPDRNVIPIPAPPDLETLLRQAKVLYASLDEQIERRKAIKKNIGGRVPYAIVSCVDGRGWTEDVTNSHLSEELLQVRKASQAAGKTWLASGAVACAVTHRDHLIGQSHPLGKVLCEDDAVFNKDFISLIASGQVAHELSKLGGVTLLNYRSRQPITADREPVARIGRYTVHRLTSGSVASAAAYFVPENVAKSIQSGQSPLRWPVDAWASFRDAGLFREIYLVHPSPARVGDFPSTINYGRNARHHFLELVRQNILLRRLRWWLLELRRQSNTKITKWT